MINPITYGWECYLPEDTANHVYFAWLIRLLSTFMFGLYLLAALEGMSVATLTILVARIAVGTLFSHQTKNALGGEANVHCWDGDLRADLVAVAWPFLVFVLFLADKKITSNRTTKQD